MSLLAGAPWHGEAPMLVSETPSASRPEISRPPPQMASRWTPPESNSCPAAHPMASAPAPILPPAGSLYSLLQQPGATPKSAAFFGQRPPEPPADGTGPVAKAPGVFETVSPAELKAGPPGPPMEVPAHVSREAPAPIGAQWHDSWSSEDPPADEAESMSPAPPSPTPADSSGSAGTSTGPTTLTSAAPDPTPPKSGILSFFSVEL